VRDLADTLVSKGKDNAVRAARGIMSPSEKPCLCGATGMPPNAVNSSDKAPSQVLAWR